MKPADPPSAPMPTNATASESLLRLLPRSLWVVGLLAIGMGALQLRWAGGQDDILLYRMGANYGYAVKAGEWQRLWLAPFLHGDGGHLLANLTGWLLLSFAVEALIAMPWTIVVGLLGALAAFGLEAWSAPNRLSYGLSSGCWALAGVALTIALFGNRHQIRISQQ